MAKNMNGLSREFIIHPGETLKEILEDRQMSQKELAIRTDVTEPHVSSIVNCQKAISVSYAKKLEYALGIDASFWVNLQANYDKELADFEEINGISDQELEILKRLSSIVKHLKEIRILEPEAHGPMLVISLRRFLNISSLTRIPQISQTGAYRLATATNIDPFVLFTWLRMCDLIEMCIRDRYYVLPYFWLPEETLELRVRRDHVPYDVWKQQGHLLTTEGNVIHYGFIEKFIEDLNTRYHIKEIAFDRWGAVQMVQNLEGAGFTVVPFGQGYKDMSPPTKELMKLTLEGKIAHGGDPVLSWMMDNIHVQTDPAGNIKPDKAKSSEKIDGAVAMIMALDRCIRNEGIRDNSVYDERGLLIL